VLPDYRSITFLYHAGAGSGLAGKLAPQVAEMIQASFPSAKLELVESKSREHIKEVGSGSSSDLIVCLSGDGSLHDIAQALARRTDSARPTLAVVPAGSGNDYARSLGLPLDTLKAAALLRECEPIKADVGLVNDTYFLETLSFGVDAAVALNTEDLRLSTKARGTRLYAHAAINAIMHELVAHEVKVRMQGFAGEEKDAVEELELEALILAVQNGPTYGGGFKVAPGASIVDGMFDVYMATNVGKLTALYYLSKMKGGKHESLKAFSYYRCSHLELEFTEQLPVQCDGERLLGSSFTVDVVPAALDVLALPSASACR
jgi:YegS/Rv2252/BmrU family lipid kinase